MYCIIPFNKHINFILIHTQTILSKYTKIYNYNHKIYIIYIINSFSHIKLQNSYINKNSTSTRLIYYFDTIQTIMSVKLILKNDQSRFRFSNAAKKTRNTSVPIIDSSANQPLSHLSAARAAVVRDKFLYAFAARGDISAGSDRMPRTHGGHSVTAKQRTGVKRR